MNDKNSKFEKMQVNGVFLKEAPSGKAFQMAIMDDSGMELTRKWLPHSQVKLMDGTRVEGSYKDEISVTLPNWLAENEGIAKLLRDNLLDKEYGGDDMEAGMEDDEGAWGDSGDDDDI